jgi:internalin A
MNAALSLINQAYEEGWEELDLSGMELTELPPEDERLQQFDSLSFLPIIYGLVF